MVCEYCGKTPPEILNRRCTLCGRVRCSPECHLALMEIDERAKQNLCERETNNGRPSI